VGARTDREPLILLALVGIALIISGWRPCERITWILESFPVLLAIPPLMITYSRFPLTLLLYRLLFLHALILLLGAHYTYAQVPIGSWVQDLLELRRNHYDRLGHFAQGFIPAILTREILVRWSPLRPGKWLSFFVLCVCLGFSACYELIEWWVALIGGISADSFLGTQGDIWDTQWDMFLALLGAIIAQLTLSRQHDRELSRIPA